MATIQPVYGVPVSRATLAQCFREEMDQKWLQFKESIQETPQSSEFKESIQDFAYQTVNIMDYFRTTWHKNENTIMNDFLTEFLDCQADLFTYPADSADYLNKFIIGVALRPKVLDDVLILEDLTIQPNQIKEWYKLVTKFNLISQLPRTFLIRDDDECYSSRFD